MSYRFFESFFFYFGAFSFTKAFTVNAVEFVSTEL